MRRRRNIINIRLACLGSPISITSIIDKHVLVYLRLALLPCRGVRVANCKSSSPANNKMKKNLPSFGACVRHASRRACEASSSNASKMHGCSLMQRVISSDLLAKSVDPSADNAGVIMQIRRFSFNPHPREPDFVSSRFLRNEHRAAEPFASPVHYSRRKKQKRGEASSYFRIEVSRRDGTPSGTVQK